jgi:heme-degrading monooxygenase HmoA
VVRIVYRHKVARGAEEGFVQAWERCRTKMLGRAPGALDATLYRDENDPTAFFSVTRWRSVEDWKAYYKEGVPDPEGEMAVNQVLVEVKSVTRGVEVKS